MKKIFVSLFLVVLLTFGLSATAMADYSEDHFYYTIEDESVTITGCFGKEAELTVPSMIANCPVNHIAAGAFVGNKYLKVVNLPDTIMSIAEGAFDPTITINMAESDSSGGGTFSPTSTDNHSAQNSVEGSETGTTDQSGTSQRADIEVEESAEELNKLDEEAAETEKSKGSTDSDDSTEKADSDNESGSDGDVAEDTDSTVSNESGEQHSSSVIIWIIVAVVVVFAVILIIRKKKK